MTPQLLSTYAPVIRDMVPTAIADPLSTPALAMEQLDVLSRTIGDTTIEYDTVSTSRGTGWGDNRAGPSESISGHVSARRLATPDEIMRMRPDQLLLLRQGEHPLAVEKIRYYDQREFVGLFDPA